MMTSRRPRRRQGWPRRKGAGEKGEKGEKGEGEEGEEGEGEEEGEEEKGTGKGIKDSCSRGHLSLCHIHHSLLFWMLFAFLSCHHRKFRVDFDPSVRMQDVPALTFKAPDGVS